MPEAPVPDYQLLMLLEYICPPNRFARINAPPGEITVTGNKIEARIANPFEKRLPRAYIDGCAWSVSFDLPKNYPNHFVLDRSNSIPKIFNVSFEGSEKDFLTEFTYAKLMM